VEGALLLAQVRQLAQQLVTDLHRSDGRATVGALLSHACEWAMSEWACMWLGDGTLLAASSASSTLGGVSFSAISSVILTLYVVAMSIA
jgi:hypothetical protein